MCILHMQYTNVYNPKPTYYSYQGICYFKRQHKTVLRERQNADQLTLGLTIKILLAHGFSEETRGGHLEGLSVIMLRWMLQNKGGRSGIDSRDSGHGLMDPRTPQKAENLTSCEQIAYQHGRCCLQLGNTTDTKVNRRPVKRHDNASMTKEIITSSHNKTSNKTFVTSVLFQDTNRNYQSE
jgi:hypothetical protein